MPGNPDRSAAPTFMVAAACFVVIVAGMRAAAEIVIPFFMAVFIAVMCMPWLTWLRKRKIPTGIAVLAVITGLMLVVFGVLTLVGTSLANFTADLPVYKSSILEKTRAFIEWLRDKGVKVPEENLVEGLNAGMVMDLVGDLLGALTNLLTNTFLILMTVIFILLESSTIPQKIQAGSDDPESSLHAYHEFTESVNRYLVMKSVISLATGATVTIFLLVLDVDYPALWGVLAFLLNFVPNVGSIIAAIPPILLGLVQIGFGTALIVAIGFLAINIVVGNVIEPRVMGRRLGLSTLVVFVSLVFWGWVLGPVGMLLSIPLTMIVKIALETSDRTRWIAILLSNDVPSEETAQREDLSTL